MKKLYLIPAGVALLTGLAACGSSTASSSAPQGNGPSSPVSVIWNIAGPYAGPVPPGWPMPGQTGVLHLGKHTTDEGYLTQVDIAFGVPLHYAIPRYLEDCYGGYQGGTQDLDPGNYVIPFSIKMTNLTGQQSKAIGPDVWVSGSDGESSSAPTRMTGQEAGTWMTWNDGACRSDVYKILNNGQYATLSGFIGPATPADLTKVWVNVKWPKYPGDSDISGATHVKLTSILSHPVSSWIIAHS